MSRRHLAAARALVRLRCRSHLGARGRERPGAHLLRPGERCTRASSPSAKVLTFPAAPEFTAADSAASGSCTVLRRQGRGYGLATLERVGAAGYEPDPVVPTALVVATD